MPEREGKLSKSEIDQVAEFVNHHALSEIDACTVCGGQTYVHPSMSRVELGTLTGLQQRAIPVVMTVCERCGYIRQFAATIVGILDATALGPHEEGQVDNSGLTDG